MNKTIVLTGDRPTGPLHLGHYIGSLKNRIMLQEAHEQYIMIADMQALTDHAEEPEKIIRSIYEVSKDYLSVGIDPERSTIFIQSAVTELSELTMYFMNLVSVARLERNPTVKNEILQKGYHDNLPVGFYCYPISQAADILAFKARIIPVGDDQLPMIELANEIVRKFNRVYHTECLVETSALLSNHTRLCGIDGRAKASKSLNNAIFLSDDTDTVKKKVHAMYTDPMHLSVKDPGSVEGNVVFSYLDAFHPDVQEVQALKDHYALGGLGDMTIKSKLFSVLEELLTPIRERRAKIHNDDLKAMLHKGTEHARAVAAKTLSEVRASIGINYI